MQLREHKDYTRAILTFMVFVIRRIIVDWSFTEYFTADLVLRETYVLYSLLISENIPKVHVTY